MSKDNILASLMGGNKSQESQLHDLFNRKTFVDDLGEGFAQQANQPAVNAKQKNTNALMGGIASGMKASQTHAREPKLKQLEEQLSQVVNSRMKIETMLGKQKEQQLAFQAYAANNFGDFKKWDEAVAKGDQVAQNQLGEVLFNRFAQENPEMGAKLGKLDHVMGGKAYFDRGGKIEGMYLKDVLQPLIDTLPIEQQKELRNLVSLTTQNNFKKTDLLEDLSIADKKAKIADSYASANQANAHADYYRGETAKIQNQRNNPPKYDEKTAQHIAKSNIDWVNTMSDDVKKTENAAKAYDMTATILADESKDTLGRGGNSLRAKIQRFINFEGTPSAKNQALLDLYQQPLLEEFKYYFGARQTDADLKQFLKTLPTLDKDSGASSLIAKERANEIRNRNKESQLRAKILENEFNYGEPYNSQAVTKRVNEEMQIQSGTDILRKK